MTMIQRKFYLPEDLYVQLQLQAKIMNKNITSVVRELLSEGLKRTKKTSKGRGAEVLLDLARMAKKNKLRGPHDLSINHDKYFVEAWEEEHPYMRRKKV